MLIKKQGGIARSTRLAETFAGVVGASMDRRTFLRRSGLAAGGAAMVAGGAFTTLRKAEAQVASQAGAVDIKLNVCTHCSVGCTVKAEVQNGVWVGQEPAFDSPINLGAHCAKGAAVRDNAHGEKRLKYPMKLVGGKWQRVSWDQAINEVGDKLLQIREKSGRRGCWGSERR